MSLPMALKLVWYILWNQMLSWSKITFGLSLMPRMGSVLLCHDILASVA